MNQREQDKRFKKLAERVGSDVIDMLREHRDALHELHRGCTAAPVLDSYGDSHLGGIFLTQGDDEIWLTRAQAKRLRNQLNQLYPKGAKA